MNKKLVFLYAGQGSQFYQMGRSLYDKDPRYHEEVTRLDRIVQELVDYSVLEEIYRQDKKKTDTFQELKYSHPAIFMSQVAVTKSLLERGVHPDYFMGCSLGEIVAAALATESIDEIFLGTLSQCDIFKMSNTGGMIAIFDELEKFYQTVQLYENCYMASKNYSEMYVVSGENENLKNVEEYLKSKNIMFQRLPVQYAFHSELIEYLKPYFLKEEGKYRINNLKTPIISCSERERILHTIQDGYFWSIIRKTIDFYGAIVDLLKTKESYLFVDLSFTGSQANYIRRITRDSNFQVYSPFTLFQSNNNLECVADTIKSMQKEC